MSQQLPDLPPAGLGRRLLALAYDLFLLAAVWFATGTVFVMLYPLTGLPMEAINGVTRPAPVYLKSMLFPLLMAATWGFYGWFWLHGGQTLGMRAWRIKVRDFRGRPLTLTQTLGRFLGAFASWLFAGGGWLLALLPPHQTLHDRLSATETVVIPKENKHRRA